MCLYQEFSSHQSSFVSVYLRYVRRFHLLHISQSNVKYLKYFQFKVVWVTDEFCPYGLLVVMYTIWPLPGCSAITQYNVSMSLSICCFNFAIISPFGWRYLKVTKVFPDESSSISNCTRSLNSPACIVHISSSIR